MLKNADAIKRSVRNLVQTIPSERFFNSTIGSEVRNLLFNNVPGFVDFGTASIIEGQIRNTIENYELRVTNLDVNVEPRPDQNEYEVFIIFDIIGQQFPTQEFSFLLKATRYCQLLNLLILTLIRLKHR